MGKPTRLDDASPYPEFNSKPLDDRDEVCTRSQGSSRNESISTA